MERNTTKKQSLGSKIRFFREIKGISQEFMASKLGISQQAYQKLETGKTRIDIERAAIIAQQLELDLEFIMKFNPSDYWHYFKLSGNINQILQPEIMYSHIDQLNALQEEIKLLRELILNKMG